MKKNSSEFPYFTSVEAIYKARLDHFISTAKRHIYNRDLALDAVHDAMAKAVAYHQKHPEQNIRQDIIDFLIIRACKKLNKYSAEIPYGDMASLENIV